MATKGLIHWRNASQLHTLFVIVPMDTHTHCVTHLASLSPLFSSVQHRRTPLWNWQHFSCSVERVPPANCRNTTIPEWPGLCPFTCKCCRWFSFLRAGRPLSQPLSCCSGNSSTITHHVPVDLSGLCPSLLFLPLPSLTRPVSVPLSGYSAATSSLLLLVVALGQATRSPQVVNDATSTFGHRRAGGREWLLRLIQLVLLYRAGHEDSELCSLSPIHLPTTQSLPLPTAGLFASLWRASFRSFPSAQSMSSGIIDVPWSRIIFFGWTTSSREGDIVVCGFCKFLPHILNFEVDFFYFAFNSVCLKFHSFASSIFIHFQSPHSKNKFCTRVKVGLY